MQNIARSSPLKAILGVGRSSSCSAIGNSLSKLLPGLLGPLPLLVNDRPGDVEPVVIEEAEAVAVDIARRRQDLLFQPAVELLAAKAELRLDLAGGAVLESLS